MKTTTMKTTTMKDYIYFQVRNNAGTVVSSFAVVVWVFRSQESGTMTILSNNNLAGRSVLLQSNPVDGNSHLIYGGFRINGIFYGIDATVRINSVL